MANTRSAIKRIKTSEKKRQRNRAVISRTRTYVKKANVLLREGAVEEAKAATLEAISALDKAAEKGVIHRNNAARRKSRLMKKLNQAAGLGD